MGSRRNLEEDQGLSVSRYGWRCRSQHRARVEFDPVARSGGLRGSYPAWLSVAFLRANHGRQRRSPSLCKARRTLRGPDRLQLRLQRCFLAHDARYGRQAQPQEPGNCRQDNFGGNRHPRQNGPAAAEVNGEISALSASALRALCDKLFALFRNIISNSLRYANSESRMLIRSLKHHLPCRDSLLYQ